MKIEFRKREKITVPFQVFEGGKMTCMYRPVYVPHQSNKSNGSCWTSENISLQIKSFEVSWRHFMYVMVYRSVHRSIRYMHEYSEASNPAKIYQPASKTNRTLSYYSCV